LKSNCSVNYLLINNCMRIFQLTTEALKPSEYRPLVKGWDKSRYANIFLDPAYKHDRNGYRVIIPIPALSTPITVDPVIKSELEANGFDILDYRAGLATNRATKQTIKIGKALTKIKRPELVNRFNNDTSREGTQKEYIAVISRHPYDIAGMSTDRGWTSCMNLHNGEFSKYVPLEVKVGSIVAYVTTADDADLSNPVGRVMIKPFVDLIGSPHVEFGIESRVYGTKVAGFIKIVNKWVRDINKSNVLDKVAVMELDPRLWQDSGPKIHVRGASKEVRKQILRLADDPMSIRYIENPTQEMKIIAVTKDADALRYIENHTPEVQMAAVKQDVNAFQFIDNPTPEVKAYVKWRNSRSS
jgi:hypothetical protein